MVSAPILAYPSPTGKYVLETDASNHSLGAVLSQFQWGEERVFAYASSHLTPAQQSYCVTRRELLAIVQYTRQYRHFLLGNKFLLRTDCGSLAWLFRFKQTEGQLARWLEELSQHDFEIEHRAGQRHTNADAMSRYRPGSEEGCNCYQAGKEVTDLPCGGCTHCTCRKLHQHWARFEEDVDDVVPLVIRQVTIQGSYGAESQPLDQAAPSVNWLQPLNNECLSAAQKKDPVLSVLHTWKKSATAYPPGNRWLW